MTHARPIILVLAAATVLAMLAVLAPVSPVGAQDGPGWLYVARGGDIVAMRPDGSDPRNLTAGSGRHYDDPDVQPSTSVEVYAQYQDLGTDGTPLNSGGVRYFNVVTAGNDFDRVEVSVGAASLSPAWGFDSQYVYFSNRGGSIDLIRSDQIETVVESPAAGNSVLRPDGTPDTAVRDAVAYTLTGAGLAAVRYRTFGANPSDVLVAAGRYVFADYARFAPDGQRLIFSCRISDGGPLQLCLSAPDEAGTGFTAIPTPVDAVNAAISPDQTRIAYRGTDGSVWVAGIDGSNPTAVLGAAPSPTPTLGLDWGKEVPLIGAPPPEPEPQPEPEPDPAPNTPLAPGGVDGDPATTDRAEFTQPGPFAAAVSAARFADADTSAANSASRRASLTGSASSARAPAQYGILGRDDQFADSLAGSPLTARGPLLYTPTGELSSDAAGELSRVLGPGATVYLLGGEGALGPAVADAVVALGFTPVRLAGPSRFETAVAIAREVVALGGSTDEVILARGVGPADNPTAAWADSVTGGAYAATSFVPVVVTQSETLHPAVREYVDDVGASATILGGTAAIHQAVEDELVGSRRIAGASRADTAARIATDLLGYTVDGAPTALVLNGFDESGWTFGLAAAGLAADLGAALLVVGADTLPPETERLLSTCGEPSIEVLVLGWETVVSAGVVTQIDDLDGGAC